MKLTIDTAGFWHGVRRRFWRWMIKGYGSGFRVPGRCADCGIPLTYAECTHYGTTCERCEGIAFHESEERNPPICAETGAPKDPRGCWNVRCQLGGTCCRAGGTHDEAAAARDVAACASTLAGCAPECGPDNRCTSGEQACKLPDAIRVPLDELEADARYLAARLANGTMAPTVGAEAIQKRTRAIREALLAQPAADRS